MVRGVALAAACAVGDRNAWSGFERRYFGYIHAFAHHFGLSDEVRLGPKR